MSYIGLDRGLTMTKTIKGRDFQTVCDKIYRAEGLKCADVAPGRPQTRPGTLEERHAAQMRYVIRPTGNFFVATPR